MRHLFRESSHAVVAVTVIVTLGTEIYELQNGIATDELPVIHLNKLSCMHSANTTEAMGPAIRTPDKNFMMILDLSCLPMIVVRNKSKLEDIGDGGQSYALEPLFLSGFVDTNLESDGARTREARERRLTHDLLGRYVRPLTLDTLTRIEAQALALAQLRTAHSKLCGILARIRTGRLTNASCGHGKEYTSWYCLFHIQELVIYPKREVFLPESQRDHASQRFGI